MEAINTDDRETEEKFLKNMLTPEMQEKYVRSRKEVEQEDPMFDPVIGNDDFDVFWYNSLRVHPSETKGCFTVSYGYTKIQVALQCQGGKYKIVDVELIP